VSNSKRRCKHCKKYFPADQCVTVPAGTFCSMSHAVEWAQQPKVKLEVNMSGIKRIQADVEFSRCIRAANGYRCFRCGAQHDKSSSGLHCSHNFSRRHRTIRWCKENALPLCYSCHEWFGGNPADSGIWLELVVGSGVIDTLREKMNMKLKVSKSEESEIARHYRNELKKIQEKLEAGEKTPIDFSSWQ